MSVITIGEIEFGQANITATDKPTQQRFRRWIKKTFKKPLKITESTSLYYGRFKRELYNKYPPKGKRPETCEDATGEKLGIDENDLWLVSQAYERKLIFVTNDKMVRLKDIVGTRVTIDPWPQ